MRAGDGSEVLPFGDAAVLVRVGGATLDERLARVAAWDAAVRGLGGSDGGWPPGVEDVVPAEASVLVRVDPAVVGVAELVTRLAALAPAPVPVGSGPLVELPVVHDGEDLDEVARLTGLTATEVVAAHTGTEWSVAFCGFAPGFAYLVGGDPRLRVPRRTEPRTAVPAGAVALAGDYCGVYPRSSPGGWQLIGRYVGDDALWDVARAAPSLLVPGTRVRFVPVAGHAAGPPATRDASAPAAEGAGARGGVAALEVLTPGLLTTVQDFGRPGLAHLGVPRSGVADRAALDAANRLVGNAPGAPGLEVTLGGLALRALCDIVVGVCGAEVPVTVDGVPHPRDAVVRVPAGATLALGTARRGIRAVVAVRGGIAVAPVLGSASSDRLSGLGPAALAPGDLLALGSHEAGQVRARVVVRDPVSPPDAVLALTVLPGPDMSERVFADFVARRWRVRPDSDRIGVRFEPVEGGATTAGTGTKASEGVVRGAVQLPPSGLPVAFLADHPTTGGYPVVACLTSSAVDLLAQARPGQEIAFALG